jgi:hypothetical protein
VAAIIGMYHLHCVDQGPIHVHGYLQVRAWFGHLDDLDERSAREFDLLARLGNGVVRGMAHDAVEQGRRPLHR